MEILDSEDEILNTTGRILGIIGGIAYLIGGITSLVGLYGSWLSTSSLMTSTAPNAMQLSNGIRISLYTQLVLLIMLITGLICQMIAFHKYSFSPKWIWRVMLFCGLLATLASIIPLNPFNLIFGIVILNHVFTKKGFYLNTDDDSEE